MPRKKPMLSIEINDEETGEYCRKEILALIAKINEFSKLKKKQG